MLGRRHLLGYSTKQVSYTRGRSLTVARSFYSRPSVAMARILCSDPIDPICPEILRNAGHTVDITEKTLNADVLKQKIPDYEALIVRSGSLIDRSLLDEAKKLRLIGRAGTGVDNIDVVNATKQGILVMNTPFGNTISAAELIVGLIATVSRIEEVTRQGTDAVEAIMKEVSQQTVRHSEIHDKTLGIIGLGRIGREVAKRCTALGMNIIGYDPILASSSAKAHGIEPVSLNELFARSDYISLHVPLNASTQQLVNEERLSLCKDGVKIINGARAGLIDHQALLKALETQKVAGVAFDILPPCSQTPSSTWQALLQHERVLVTPHIGALTSDAQKKVARDLAYQINDALAGKSFKGVLNAPNIDFARREEHVPFLSLAEKLGSMQAQLLDDCRLSRILVISEGRHVTSPELSTQIVNGVLKGLLSHMLEEEVTFENARHIAEVMGIQCVEHKHEEVSGSSFSNLLSVVFERVKEKKEDQKINTNQMKITGTVLGKSQMRLVEFNDLSMDAIPSGSMLMFHNTDEPGVLHSVTQVLAKNQINIGCFGLARENKGGNAVGILNVDENIPDKVLDELEALQHISNVRKVNLLELEVGSRSHNSILEPFLKKRKDGIHEDEEIDSATSEQDDDVFIVSQDASSVKVSKNPKPVVKPFSANFGSGPCKKRPGYSLSKLSEICLGRSHRSKLGKGLLEEAINQSKRVLQLPEDYLLGIVPASDTGAFEMAMWNMLGQRRVDIFYWESFGQGWFKDAVNELNLGDQVHEYSAPFGELPDLSQANGDHDIIFTWNGTTSGVRVPNGDWIPDDRQGLVFNDATSAAFAMDIPWHKIDVCTFSWQKVLGGEGAHGVLILSPRAVERLESFVPENRPMPKIFKLTNGSGKLSKGIFEGSTINTPSMLCVEDYLDALRWAESVGGTKGLIEISKRNLKVVEDFVADNSRWFKFLPVNEQIRSNTSVCLLIEGLSKDEVKEMLKLLEKEQVAFDIGSYRDAPPGIRIWCGATVETKDLEKLMPWLKWAYLEIKAKSAKQE